MHFMGKKNIILGWKHK